MMRSRLLNRPRKLPPLPAGPRRMSMEEALAAKRAGKRVRPDQLSFEAQAHNARLKFVCMDTLPKRVRKAVADSLYGVPAEWAHRLLQGGYTEADVVRLIAERDAELRRKFEAERGR